MGRFPILSVYLCLLIFITAYIFVSGTLLFDQVDKSTEN